MIATMGRRLSAIATRLAIASVLATSAADAMAADGAAGSAQPIRLPPIVGDAIVQSLTGRPGDPQRGRRIVADRRLGLCLLCHQAPISEERFQGDLAPDLAGVGARLSAGQLRLRLVDSRRLNPASIMPAYHRIDGLTRVAPERVGEPLLDAGQIEDVVAWLASLR